MAYAQVRMLSRYGERADASVWIKLHTIDDLGSYLQTAQQTPLRPWVLGLSSSHSSHDLELALRQKYRHHVDEVAGWMPANWQKPVQWIKRLVDLPVLQYLGSGGEPLNWMRSDPAISDFTVDDPLVRLQAIRQAGSRAMADSWLQSGSMLSGWLSQWNSIRPRSINFDRGLQSLEQLLHQQMQLQTQHPGLALPSDYEIILDQLRLIFRRYAFQPAAACAYLVIVAIDLHRLRSDLMQRLYFQTYQEPVEALPL